MEMAGKLAPGRQSYRIDARVGVRYQAARLDGPPLGLPHTRLGARSAAFLRCLTSRPVIVDVGATDAG